MDTAERTTKKHKDFFVNYSASAQLKKLAQTPFDLSKEGNLTPERLKKYTAEACGYQFFYGTEKITDEVMSALEALAQEARAVQKMHEMQSGKILNRIEGYPSDHRAVLHTAMRDLFGGVSLSPPDVVDLENKEHEKLKQFLKKIESEHAFTDLVTIGIGGSDLGPKAVYTALQYLQKSGRSVHFISNIDPDAVAAALKDLNLNKTLVMVISKSGSTLETVTNESFVRSLFQKANIDSKRHFVSVTGKGSPIDDPKNYLECFYSWDYIGGRFCTTAMYGGVMLSFAFGYEHFLEFLRGAHEMDQAALSEDLKENIPLLMALLGIWNRNFLDYPTVALVPYSQALSRFSAHIQQVDMESNGKRIDKQAQPVPFHTGPIIWGEPGTSAQHSFYQLIHQGTDIIPLELVGFKESQFEKDFVFQGTSSQEKLLANLFAQILALALGKKSENPNQVFPGNRPSCLLLGKKLTPYTMGALFALYEHKIAFQGFIWNINSFDQEGVMLGKVLAKQVLEQMALRRKDAKGKPFPLGDVFLDALEGI